MRRDNVYLYAEENLSKLARLLVSVWGPRLAVERAKILARGSRSAVNLVALIETVKA